MLIMCRHLCQACQVNRSVLCALGELSRTFKPDFQLRCHTFLSPSVLLPVMDNLAEDLLLRVGIFFVAKDVLC